MLRCTAVVFAACSLAIPVAADPLSALAAPGDCARPSADYETPPLYQQQAGVAGPAAQHFVPNGATSGLVDLLPVDLTRTTALGGVVSGTVEGAAGAVGEAASGTVGGVAGVVGDTGSAIGLDGLGSVAASPADALGDVTGSALGTATGTVDALTDTATGTTSNLLGIIK